MKIKYDIDIDNKAVLANLNRLTNLIYKLLPSREEGLNWEAPLSTIMEELGGMDRMLLDQHTVFFRLLCKLEGLFNLTEKQDFQLFRGVIFESLSLLDGLKKTCQD